jgi:hypothetical protein
MAGAHIFDIRFRHLGIAMAGAHIFDIRFRHLGNISKEWRELTEYVRFRHLGIAMAGAHGIRSVPPSDIS